MNRRFPIPASPALCAALLALHAADLFVAHSKAAPFTDANWISMGVMPGADNSVWAAVADDWGNVYIAGDFIVVGETRTGHVAKWNGTNWSRLSGSPSGRVRALAVSGSDLYAAGDFTLAGSSRIAKWNGSSWSPLGSGIDSVVTALAVSGNDVYAGGAFTKAGGVSANRIAKWNGSSWSPLGSGILGPNSGVSALAVSGSDLYVGGMFTNVGGSRITNIAKWNGNNWSAVGSGVSGTSGWGLQVPPSHVSALAVSGSDLYVGGVFTNAGGSAAANIAKWDGNNWSPLGAGISDSYSHVSQVSALAVLGNEVYAGGSFSMAGGNPASSIAKWNGTSWSALGSGITGTVQTLAVSRGDLYAGGYFNVAGGRPANYIAKWDGSTWHTFGSNGLQGPVSAIAVLGTEVYAGRYKWNGTNWSRSSDFNGSVEALAVSGSNLYMGGWFYAPDGSPVNVAKWDGTSWSALGSWVDWAVDERVSALAVSGDDLYAGGWFTNAGGTPANYIAQWDGTNWSPLGSGMNSVVLALAVSGSDVYAGGYFTAAGGSPADYIAKWDGTNWSALGSARLDGYVYALATSGTDLYAGGAFTKVDERWVYNIAKWDGTNWTGLGVWPGGFVFALAVSGGDMYTGYKKWDGTNWSSLGFYGLNGTVRALAILDNQLYAGGDFTMAGGKNSSYATRAYLELPALSILRSGSAATVSWPASASFDGFVLQQTPDLTKASSWSNASYPITTNGTTKRATVPLTPAEQFFRLIE